MSFYDNLILICKKNGVAPSAIAEKAGFNKSVVSYWKKNRDALPKFETVERFATALGVEPGQLDERFIITSDKIHESIERTGEILSKSPFLSSYEAFIDNIIDTVISGLLSEDTPLGRINAALEQLNETGQKIAVERVEELTKIPDYRQD